LNLKLSSPKEYNTQIGERGVLISGGQRQRQRLALSRVMLKRPKIMVLDEATSALDTESEKLVQAALSNILHLQTTFVIAHSFLPLWKQIKFSCSTKGK
jgi:ABC-type multidrug transport system fused ATPase/permease subunit